MLDLKAAEAVAEKQDNLKHQRKTRYALEKFSKVLEKNGCTTSASKLIKWIRAAASSRSAASPRTLPS